MTRTARAARLCLLNPRSARMASEALPVCEVGIIGGTGVYGLQDMANKREVGVISIFSASASLSPRHLPFDLLRTANPSAYPCASSIYPHERTAPFIAFHRSSSTRPSASRRAPSSSVSLTVLASPSWRATTCTTAFSLRRSRTRRTCVPTSHGASLRAHFASCIWCIGYQLASHVLHCWCFRIHLIKRSVSLHQDSPPAQSRSTPSSFSA